MNKLKDMAYNTSHASRIVTEKTIFAQTFFAVSSKISPILVTRFLSNEWWNIGKKLLKLRFWSTNEKEKEKKK